MVRMISLSTVSMLYLDDVVQDLERDRGRDLDPTPDQRIVVLQLDANGGDLVEAVGCGVLGVVMSPVWQVRGADVAT
jgi:hypothetical protein